MNEDITKLHEKEMSYVYGYTLTELAHQNKDIVVLEADLMRCHHTGMFRKEFPERFINVGLAEQNLIGVAAGLSSCGKIPFAATFTPFASRRACDQVAISVAYTGLNVKIVGTMPGITAQKNGGTHMSYEDISIIRSLANMKVICPCDAYELRSALYWIAEYNGPVYLRLMRVPRPAVFNSDFKFQIGKAVRLREGNDVTIISTEYMTPLAIESADILAKDGINAGVLHMGTIKPLDVNAVLEAIDRTGRIITVENHSIIGGLGSAVAEVIAEAGKGKLMRIGVKDRFGEVGTIDYLLEIFGMSVKHIVKATQEVIK